jgi:catechol 2,3-dioxygenase-like lactoylglutathione lyase family enzyme
VRRRTLVFAGLVLAVLAAASTASAQLVAAKDGPVVYGHHHIYATNIEEHKKFFVNTLGGVAIKVGTNNLEIIKFPNVLIFFRAQAPTGGTKGSTADHIGFSVPDIRAAVTKLKANGYKMITTTDAPAGREIKDDIAAAATPNGSAIAFALGPDDVKIELVEAKAQRTPIQLHHLHMFSQKNTEMQAWYAKTFGARPRPATPGAVFVSADLPGVIINFTPASGPVAGTPGRAVDHIGFEVKNLEAFTKQLEASGVKLARPYTKVEALGISIAFVTDPWGTSIELTEGLDKIQ